MTQRIRLILILVIVSVLGILILQGYWISNSYTINRKQLLRELNLALEISVDNEMNEHYNQLSKLIKPDDKTATLSFPGDPIKYLTLIRF